MGAETSDVGIDADKVQAQLPKVDSAADEAEDARSAMETVAYDQTESRWGVESGPEAFRTRYSKELWDAHDALQKVQEDLAGFRPLLSKAVQAVRDVDSDSAVQFEAVTAAADLALSSYVQSTNSPTPTNSSEGSSFGVPASPSAG